VDRVWLRAALASGGGSPCRDRDERRRRQHREADEQPGGHLEGRRLDVVHTLIDCVPAGLRRAMLDHSLVALVAPGGRLVVSHYSAPAGGRTDDLLRGLGYEVGGFSAFGLRPVP
jgi:hypothetical protein